MTILIADNDPGVTLVLEHTLRRDGFDAIEKVPDGKAALERLSQGGVDLLICDLDMPEMSGEDLLQELHNWDAPPPVVVVSAFLDAVVERSLARSKALRGTLLKPFDLGAFAETVQAALAVERPGGAAPGAADAVGEGVEVDAASAEEALLPLPGIEPVEVSVELRAEEPAAEPVEESAGQPAPAEPIVLIERRVYERPVFERPVIDRPPFTTPPFTILPTPRPFSPGAAAAGEGPGPMVPPPQDESVPPERGSELR